MALVLTAVRRSGVLTQSGVRRFAGGAVPGSNYQHKNWLFNRFEGPRAMPGIFTAIYDTIIYQGPKCLWGAAIPIGFTTAMLSGCFLNNYRRNTVGFQYNKPDGAEGGGGH